MITKVTGIIVSSVNYGESSLVIQLYTKEYGLIGVMAKGVKSIKSKLRAFVMQFTYGFFYLYYKEGKLSILKDVDVIENFSNIFKDITKISYLNYIVDLSTQVYKESLSPKIFDYMIETIKKLNEGFHSLVLVNILEMKYLAFLGVSLYMDGCICCGSKTNIVTIDEDKGGLLCKKCYQNERLVKAKTIQVLRMYDVLDIKNISKLNIEDDIIKEIDLFLTHYYSRYTGMYLQSKDFIKKIDNM